MNKRAFFDWRMLFLVLGSGVAGFLYAGPMIEVLGMILRGVHPE